VTHISRLSYVHGFTECGAGPYSPKRTINNGGEWNAYLLESTRQALLDLDMGRSRNVGHLALHPRKPHLIFIFISVFKILSPNSFATNNEGMPHVSNRTLRCSLNIQNTTDPSCLCLSIPALVFHSNLDINHVIII